MLGAYFDDSGTHDGSEIVVVGGIIGLKERITEFHASDCYHSRGEFAGWKRHETDHFREQLRGVIFNSKVSAYSFACVRSEWDAEIKGKHRDLFGDSERYAITSCFIRSLRWARRFTFDPEISFVFDDKPERTRETKAISNAFQLHEQDKSIVRVEFRDSKKVPALQAADMFVWEFNRWAQDILELGNLPPTTKEMKQLAKRMYYVDGQIARQEKIREMRDRSVQDSNMDIDFMADYFRSYGLSATKGETASKKGARRSRKASAK